MLGLPRSVNWAFFKTKLYILRLTLTADPVVSSVSEEVDVGRAVSLLHLPRLRPSLPALPAIPGGRTDSSSSLGILSDLEQGGLIITGRLLYPLPPPIFCLWRMGGLTNIFKILCNYGDEGRNKKSRNDHFYLSLFLHLHLSISDIQIDVEM